MKGSIRRRVEDLEGRAASATPSPEWSREEMAERVLDQIDFAVATDSPVVLCEAELEAVGVAGVGDLPEWLRPRIQIPLPAWGKVRHRYEDPPQRPFEGWRERVDKHQERVEERCRESKQRDRELLERNRAACGLPALTPEQISQWELKETRWEPEDA